MLRLAHRILSREVLKAHSACGQNDTEGAIAYARKMIPAIPTITADNVAELYVSQRDGGKDLAPSSFPNPVPPFREQFVEWNVCDSVHGMGLDQSSSQVGALVWNEEPTEGQAKSLGLPLEMIFSMSVASLFAVKKGMGEAAWLGVVSWFVHKETMLADDRIYVHPDYDDKRWGAFIYPALFTFSLMHCKNVSTSDMTHDLGPTEKWLRRARQPLIRYHVLEIDPMKKVLRTEGNVEANGLKKALHICRGHFATYTADKPLFGRVVGTVWKAAHVRGSIEHGAVVKDYAVKAPQPAAPTA